MALDSRIASGTNQMAYVAQRATGSLDSQLTIVYCHECARAFSVDIRHRYAGWCSRKCYMRTRRRAKQQGGIL